MRHEIFASSASDSDRFRLRRQDRLLQVHTGKHILCVCPPISCCGTSRTSPNRDFGMRRATAIACYLELSRHVSARTSHKCSLKVIFITLCALRSLWFGKMEYRCPGVPKSHRLLNSVQQQWVFPVQPGTDRAQHIYTMSMNLISKLFPTCNRKVISCDMYIFSLPQDSL